MPRFKKGQIVAVNSPEEDDRQWHLRLYESQITSDVHKTYSPEKQKYDTWSLCRPAEEVWPEIFLGWERRAGEQAADAVGMEAELVQRLRRQIRWLCNVLKNDARTEDNNPLCPLNVPWDCEHTPCDACWEQASLKAVENADGA